MKSLFATDELKAWKTLSPVLLLNPDLEGRIL